MSGTDFPLPGDLPRPVDDGAADRLPGAALPALALPSTAGAPVDLSRLGPGRTVIYVYPMTGRPGVALPPGWDEIPGARGCTPEACGFRDHFDELGAAGAAAVYGLSSQGHRVPARARAAAGAAVRDALRRGARARGRARAADV